MLSASTTPDLIEDALRRGASAYVLKTVDPSDLPSTLRRVTGGTVFSTVGATEPSISSGAKAAGLTDREVAILTELASGKSNDEIAKELWVTQQTVKFHLTNVYRKLGAKNRADAVRQAYQLGLIRAPARRRLRAGGAAGRDGGARPLDPGLCRGVWTAPDSVSDTAGLAPPVAVAKEVIPRPAGSCRAGLSRPRRAGSPLRLRARRRIEEHGADDRRRHVPHGLHHDGEREPCFLRDAEEREAETPSHW